MTYFILVSLILLLLVSFQDFRSRTVYAVVFPLLFLSNLIVNLPFAEEGHWWDLLFNFLLVTGNLLLASVYFSVKNRALVNVAGKMIGWGDVLFFVCICPLFSFADFCIFFPLSLLVSLLIWLPVFAWRKEQRNRIPLAGLQAIPVMAVLVAKMFGEELNFAVLLSTAFQ